MSRPVLVVTVTTGYDDDGVGDDDGDDGDEGVQCDNLKSSSSSTSCDVFPDRRTCLRPHSGGWSAQLGPNTKNCRHPRPFGVIQYLCICVFPFVYLCVCICVFMYLCLYICVCSCSNAMSLSKKGEESQK